MVDGPGSFDTQTPPAPQIERPAGFLSSTTGKLVLGGVALVVVLAIVGGMAWYFLVNSASSGTPSVPPSTAAAATGSSATSSTVATATAEPIVEPMEKPLESTFTFRNVFAPTLKQQFPPSVTTSATSGSTTTSSTAPVNVPPDTLFLQSIQTVNSVTTATFIWNGNTYTLKEGDTIPDSPWKVLSIGTNSVVMLFGDTEVTLSTGQGLAK